MGDQSDIQSLTVCSKPGSKSLGLQCNMVTGFVKALKCEARSFDVMSS